MKIHARVGSMAVGLGAYWPQFPGMRETIAANHDRLNELVGRYGEVVAAGVVDGMDSAARAGRLFAQSDVDVLFVHLATYANSETLLPAIRELDAPVVLMNVQPFRVLDFKAAKKIDDWLGTAVTPAALPEMTNVLQRLGRRFDTVSGYLGGDPVLESEVKKWCAVAGLRQRLRKQTMALIGRPFAGMMDLNLDETSLFARLGLFVRHLDWDDILAERDAVTSQDVESAVTGLKAIFPSGGLLTDADYEEIGAFLAATLRLADRHDLCAIASHFEGPSSPERDRLIAALNPVLSVLNGRGIACPVEADMKVAIAMLTMRSFAPAATLAELYSMDFEGDVVIIGHSGAGDPAISDAPPSLTKSDVLHGKSGSGFLTQFFPGIGPATLLSFTQRGDGDFRFVAAEGEIVSGDTLNLGDTNCRVRFDGGIRSFIRDWAAEGPSHHGVLAHGHYADEIRAAALGLDVPVNIIREHG